MTTHWTDFYDCGAGDFVERAIEFQTHYDEEAKKQNLFFRRPLLDSGNGRATVHDTYSGENRQMLMFGSNSYLGLTTDPRVVNATIEATKKYGYGTGAVSLYAGTTDLHIELEKRIANFYQCEDAILFPTGYAANVGVLSGLLRKGDAAINDMCNHASIFDGCRLSEAKIYNFAHRHTKHLEKVLKKASAECRSMLIITDGVFSMDGDIARLDEIVEMAHKYGARVMVDEAHALGTIGPTGRGTAEHTGTTGRIDLTIGTLSKTPGAIGGYAVGRKEVINYLRYFARTYFFSTSIPTPIIAGAIKVFDILEQDQPLRQKLRDNVKYTLTKLNTAGFNTGHTESAIIPIIVGDEEKLKRFSQYLHQHGIFMNFVAYPAVAKKRCRLRMNVMASHTIADLDYTVETLIQGAKRLGIIQ